jgi:hypothetical protein
MGYGVKRERLKTPAPAPLADQGIRRLCLALIEGCVQDLQLAKTVQHWGLNKPHVASELSWIRSAKQAPGSFAWACHALDIDPGYLRRGLLARFASGFPSQAERQAQVAADRKRLRRIRRARVR